MPFRRRSSSSLNKAPHRRKISASSLDDDHHPASSSVDSVSSFEELATRYGRQASASSLDDPPYRSDDLPVRRLAIPQRPNLTNTPSGRPLLAESPGAASPLPTPDPLSSRYPDVSSVDGSEERATGPYVAPKIRINDMSNSPPAVEEVPSTSSTGAGISFFPAETVDPASVPESPSSPTPLSPIHQLGRAAGAHRGDLQSTGGSTASPEKVRNEAGVVEDGSNTDIQTLNTTFGPSAAVGSSSVTISGPSGISARTTGIHPISASASKNTIASRRAKRISQAISTSNSRPTKLDELAGHKKSATINRKIFKSTRLTEEIYKPWLEKPDPALRWARYITLLSIFIGLALAGVICWDGYRSVPSLGKICSVINEDFSGGTIDSSIFEHEVRLDGYGPGSFSWTTTSSNNSYVEDGILYIVPTLTSDTIGVDAISDGYTLNLTADGTCTTTNQSQCVATSNSSLLTVINPVQTARLITKNTVSIKYGKVEVKAKFPSGDWLWPRIMMLPVNDTYGSWPRSGQIDILNGRGNNASYATRGVDYAQSDLHWGPTEDLDKLYLTWGYREQRRTYYSGKFHTFGLEWNDYFMWTYIDSRIYQVMSLRFNKESFWSRGDFGSTYTNGTEVVKLTNAWSSSENNVAPFDQAFYLVIDLAVGSTDGWFPDDEGGKPWTDDSTIAMSDFWDARSKWNGTSWSSNPKEKGFAIDSVKMWKTC